MSLTSAMYTGTSGLLANANALSVIGNDISNSNTVGYKSATTLFADMLSQNIGNNSQVGTGVKVQDISNNFSQGSLENTTNATDLAIQGNSFFALAAPNTTAATNQNAAYLTRAGSFNVNSSYNLVNPDGYEVLEAKDGLPIKFSYVNGTTAGDFSKVTAIDSKGVITYQDVSGNSYYYNGNGGAVLLATSANYNTALANGAIAVVTPPNTAGLTKVGGTLFQSTAASGVPASAFTAATNTTNGTSQQLLSNELELSNVDMATELVNMLTTQRAYSANSKTITTADQMTQTVLGLVQ
ncbi:MAG: flagellar hook basal-body protein [Geobacteraceae bacterium]|nr:flagellar hook basal-body protein [Geobacteraceae bacterium]